MGGFAAIGMDRQIKALLREEWDGVSWRLLDRRERKGAAVIND